MSLSFIHIQVLEVLFVPATLMPFYCQQEKSGIVIDMGHSETRLMLVRFLVTCHKLAARHALLSLPFFSIVTLAILRRTELGLFVNALHLCVLIQLQPPNS